MIMMLTSGYIQIERKTKKSARRNLILKALEKQKNKKTDGDKDGQIEIQEGDDRQLMTLTLPLVFDHSISMLNEQKVDLDGAKIRRLISNFQNTVDFKNIVEVLLRNKLGNLLFEVFDETSIAQVIRNQTVVMTFVKSLEQGEL